MRARPAPRRSRARRGLALVLLAATAAAWLAGCGALGFGSRVRRAEEVVARAVQLCEQGSTREAVDLVQAELGASDHADVAYLRHFTLGWLYEELPRQPGEEGARAAHLDAAEAEYRAALAVRPGSPDASVNLALLRRERAGETLRAGGAGAVAAHEAAVLEAIEVLEAVDPAGEEPLETYRRRVAVGDAWLDLAAAGGGLARERFDRALDAYRTALDMDVDDDLAPLKLVAARALEGDRAGPAAGDAWAAALEAECAELAARFPQAALRGHEVLAAHGAGAAEADRRARGLRALHGWLRLEARTSAFSAASLERLPPPDAWGDDGPLVAELAQLAAQPAAAAALPLWNERPAPPPPAEEDAAPDPERDRADEGRRDEALRRRQTLALLVQSLGAARAVRGDVAGAAELYGVALEVAPGVAAYAPPPPAPEDAAIDEPGAPGSEADDGGPLAGEPVVGLDVALDQLLLLQGHGEVADPDGARLAQVLDHPLFARDTLRSIEALDRDGYQRLHVVLGLILAQQDAWGTDGPWEDPWRTAPPHLREALRVALANPAVARGPNGRPLPELSRVLADGLAPAGRRPAEAVDAYLDAALGYHDLGDDALAEESFERAESLAAQLSLDAGRELRAVQDELGVRRGGFLPVRWLPAGWYVGAGAAYSSHTLSGGDVDSDLAAMGNTTSTSFDGEDLGGRFFVGYQFEQPVAFEFGYLGMGEAESSIVATGVTDLNQLARDIDDVHPFLADGFTFATRVNLWGGGPVTVTGRLGAWVWDGTKEALVATNLGTITTRSTERGHDLFFGLGAILGDWRGFRATVDWDRYNLDGDGVDVVSVGFLYSLGTR